MGGSHSKKERHQEHVAQPYVDNVDRQDSACQKQFNPGEETYRCIDCEITDDTPVLCKNCFDATEHRNHRWEMLRDEGEGWCDCGDATAWREPFVYCNFHGPSYNTPNPGYEQAPSYPGVQTAPPPVQPDYAYNQPGYPAQGGPPGGQYPQQGSQYPPHGGQYPPPGGQYPPPGHQYSQPGGQHPQQGGQYHPQGGPHQPPSAEYPPQGGNYPGPPPPTNPAYSAPSPYNM